jgi:30S ribosomal protein S31
MGKGDKRTKRGKLWRATYGKSRRPANKKKKDAICPPVKQGTPQPVAQASGSESK